MRKCCFRTLRADRISNSAMPTSSWTWCAHTTTRSAEWRRASDRYVPLAIVPYLSSPETIKREVERAAAAGHRGVNLLGQMPKGIAAHHGTLLGSDLGRCQAIGVPIHFHGSAGFKRRLVGAQMERLFAAPGPFGADRHLGGDAGADHSAIHLLRVSPSAFPVSSAFSPKPASAA